MDVRFDDELLQICALALGGGASKAELEKLVYGDGESKQVGTNAPLQRG